MADDRSSPKIQPLVEPRHQKNSVEQKHRKSSIEPRDHKHRKSSPDLRNQKYAFDTKSHRTTRDKRRRKSSTELRPRHSSSDHKHQKLSIDIRPRKSSIDTQRRRKSSPDLKRRKSSIDEKLQNQNLSKPVSDKKSRKSSFDLRGDRTSFAERRRQSSIERRRRHASEALEMLKATDSEDDVWSEQNHLRARERVYRPGCVQSSICEIKLRYWCRLIAYTEMAVGLIRLIILIFFIITSFNKKVYVNYTPVSQVVEIVAHFFGLLSGLLLFLGVSCLMKSPCMANVVLTIVSMVVSTAKCMVEVTYEHTIQIEAWRKEYIFPLWLREAFMGMSVVIQGYFIWCSLSMYNHISFGDKMEEERLKKQEHHKSISLTNKAIAVRDISKIELLLAA